MIAPGSLESPQGGRITLGLKQLTDDEVMLLLRSHQEAMDGNTHFPHPVPSNPEFIGLADEFADLMAELALARALAQNLTERKNHLRAKVNAVLTQRAHYIEIASNGAPSVMATAALPLRRERRRLGALAWPQNFRAQLVQAPGTLVLRWKPVARSRSYVVEMCEPDINPDNWLQAYIGGRASCTLTNLTSGHRYAFRLATIGGKDGQSPWSPVITRIVG